jgi:hypothetical protein
LAAVSAATFFVAVALIKCGRIGRAPRRVHLPQLIRGWGHAAGGACPGMA